MKKVFMLLFFCFTLFGKNFYGLDFTEKDREVFSNIMRNMEKLETYPIMMSQLELDRNYKKFAESVAQREVEKIYKIVYENGENITKILEELEIQEEKTFNNEDFDKALNVMLEDYRGKYKSKEEMKIYLGTIIKLKIANEKSKLLPQIMYLRNKYKK